MTYFLINHVFVRNRFVFCVTGAPKRQRNKAFWKIWRYWICETFLVYDDFASGEYSKQKVIELNWNYDFWTEIYLFENGGTIIIINTLFKVDTNLQRSNIKINK